MRMQRGVDSLSFVGIFQKEALLVACKESFFCCMHCCAFLIWTKKNWPKKQGKSRNIPQPTSSYLSFSEALLKLANIRPAVFPLCQGTSTWLITSRRPIILEISNLRCNSAPKPPELPWPSQPKNSPGRLGRHIKGLSFYTLGVRRPGK